MVAGKLDGTISFDEVRRLLDYDQHTGVMRWRMRVGCRGQKGARAGTKKPRGHTEIKINGVRYQAHRLAWLWMTGRFPVYMIDHKDLNCGNNAWLNLREADDTQNNANRRAQKNNKLGVKGVHRLRRGEKYKAQIKVGGRVMYLGTFDTPEQAKAAYQTAANRHFGVYARD